jgi:hypothetical protein
MDYIVRPCLEKKKEEGWKEGRKEGRKKERQKERKTEEKNVPSLVTSDFIFHTIVF